MTQTITIVGGCYGEECAYPRRQVYRGSGGRAAALLSTLGVTVELQTMMGPDLENEFVSIAKSLNYKLVSQESLNNVWFRYRFPLGRPDIFEMGQSEMWTQKNISADNLLVFGMIEGRPITKARRVVYDPQDGRNSKHYDFNGSEAEEIALVISLSEGIALTNLQTPESIAEKLLARPFTNVVIVKCGPQGAFVKTQTTSSWVYSFPTRNVYKIGSGDIFSAAFAYAWLIDQQPAIDSAWFASRVAAGYVESGLDRFDSNTIKSFKIQANLAYKKNGKGFQRPIPNEQIYLAGPFFCTSQQWMIDETRGALKDMGFNVFSPIHDVGEGCAEDVAKADLTALENSSVVLALLDGLDAGTLFEVGYARAKKIPVVVVTESVPKDSLTMIFGSGCYVTNDLTTGIYATCWHLMDDIYV